MNQDNSTNTVVSGNEATAKRALCIWSIVSLIISLMAAATYFLVLMERIMALRPVWATLGIISVFFPAVAKRIRLSKEQSGRSFEITAIIIGGFAFATIIMFLTGLPFYFWYIGWIIGGIIYKFAGKEKR